ncbi:MAG: Gfo/Idh/MocA family oxidoreductase [Proteobacteria bacterium]|nr:Gfo/Idh/MocA family oxidoreductase [Pseudomonadota bacterium]
MADSGKKPDPKVAVVGCGHWGENLVRNFHQLGSLVCVHDIKSKVTEKITAAYPVPSSSFQEILENDSIDGVVIATPAEQHAEMAAAVLRAGKSVFVEKPLALRVSEAERLCQQAGEAGLVLMVGHLLQYHPAFEKLKEICQSGALGRVQYVYSHRLHLGRFRTEENILWSFAPHDISMILGLLGDDLESVSATGHSFLNHDVADVTTTHLKFTSGQAAHIFVSWLHPFKEQRLVIVGNGGMAVFDDTLGWPEKISIFPEPVTWNNGIPVPTEADRETVPLEEAEPLNLECRHFLNCVETGETPRTDGQEGLRVLRVLDAAQRSIESGETLKLSKGRAVL